MKAKKNQKKVSITSKPSRNKPLEFNPDDWVSGKVSVVSEKKAAPHQTQETEIKKEPSIKMKRITFDISADLHRKIKIACVSDGINMADAFRAMLEKKYETVDL